MFVYKPFLCNNTISVHINSMSVNCYDQQCSHISRFGPRFFEELSIFTTTEYFKGENAIERIPEFLYGIFRVWSRCCISDNLQQDYFTNKISHSFNAIVRHLLASSKSLGNHEHLILLTQCFQLYCKRYLDINMICGTGHCEINFLCT